MIRRFERLVYGEHPARGGSGGGPGGNPTIHYSGHKEERKREVKKRNRQKFRDYAKNYGLNQKQADKKYHEIITRHNKNAMSTANAQALAAHNPGFRANNPARPETRTKINYDPKYGASTNVRLYSYGGGILNPIRPEVSVNSFSVYDELAKDYARNPKDYRSSSTSAPTRVQTATTRVQTAPAQRSVAPRSTSVQPQPTRKITQTRPVGSAPPVKGAKQRGRNKLGNAGGPSGSRRVSLGGALQVGAGR